MKEMWHFVYTSKIFDTFSLAFVNPVACGSSYYYNPEQYKIFDLSDYRILALNTKSMDQAVTRNNNIPLLKTTLSFSVSPAQYRVHTPPDTGLCSDCEQSTAVHTDTSYMPLFSGASNVSIPQSLKSPTYIRPDLQEMGCGYMDWIGLAQDRDGWRTLVSAVMNLCNAGNFLTKCRRVCFSRRTLHHGVGKY